MRRKRIRCKSEREKPYTLITGCFTLTGGGVVLVVVFKHGKKQVFLHKKSFYSPLLKKQEPNIPIFPTTVLQLVNRYSGG